MRYLAALLLLVASTAYAAEASGPAPDGQASSDLRWTHNGVDTEIFRLFWGFGQSANAEGQLDIPNTGDSVRNLPGHSITVVGNEGDTVEVFYWMRAIDTDGNTEDPSNRSNVISKIFTITDDGQPPDAPVLEFGLPISMLCRTPEGDPCGLIEIASSE